MTGNTTSDLCAVWGSSSSDVFAVGYSGTILHYDGTAWSAMTAGTTNELSAVWGSSSSDVFAVGYAGTILHYDGSAWSAMTAAATDWLRGAWGTSSSDVFVVGLNDAILRYSAYVIPIITPFITSPTFVSPPTITSFSSSKGTQGQSLDVTINGTNFSGANAVSFGYGITVNSFTVVSPTQIMANITLSSTANLGARSISVTTLGGTATEANGFTVTESNKGLLYWVWIAVGVAALVVIAVGAIVIRRRLALVRA
jgi:hypothetical protein